MNHWSSPGQNLSIEEASPHGGLVLTPHPALSPRRGNPSVACLEVRRSRTSSAAFGDSVVVRTFLLPPWRRLFEPKRSFNSTTRRRAFLPLLGERAG